MDTIDKINLYLSKRGKTGADLSRELGLSNSIYSQWNTKKTRPGKANLARIAEYFDIPVEDLLPDEHPVTQGGEKPAGDTGGQREDAMQAFRDAAAELQEAVKKINDENFRASLGTEDVSVICPIDGTKQVIRQPYAEIEGKRYAELNRGCGRAVTGPQCELCRMQAMLAVMRGRGVTLDA